MLAQEPWGFTPDQIGRLTDWQIEYLYARPAVEASKGRSSAPGAAVPRPSPATESSGPAGEPGSPVHRRQCVDAYVNVQGLSRERAERQYDKQLAQWQSEQTAKG